MNNSSIRAKRNQIQKPSRLDRRDLLQIGCSSFLGMSLPALLKATDGKRNGKSVILVFQTGGGSQLDTFDPKPDAPDNVRGEFSTTQTKIPGVLFSEHLPKLASRTDKIAVVRSLRHSDNRHLSGTHNTLTGEPQVFRGDANEDKELSRLDRPCYGGGLRLLNPTLNGMPCQVTVPRPLIEGALTWPGQHAGFLGPKFDPWQVSSNPNDKDFKVHGVQLLEGMTTSRLSNRFDMLETMNSQQRSLDRFAKGIQFTSQQQEAYSMLTSPNIAKAFDIGAEDSGVRDRYGRNEYGQTILLARRLVEYGVPYVQCNMGIVQSWDTHSDNFPRQKTKLLPGIDGGVSALIDDLVDRNMLDDVLIVVVGEFGRTPTINKNPGRDHWAWGYSGLFIGGGVRGGQVIGKSDRQAGHPETEPYHPNDIGATIYHTLGISPESEMRDQLDRPLRLNNGEVMHALYS